MGLSYVISRRAGSHVARDPVCRVEGQTQRFHSPELVGRCRRRGCRRIRPSCGGHSILSKIAKCKEARFRPSTLDRSYGRNATFQGYLEPSPGSYKYWYVPKCKGT